MIIVPMAGGGLGFVSDEVFQEFARQSFEGLFREPFFEAHRNLDSYEVAGRLANHVLVFSLRKLASRSVTRVFVGFTFWHLERPIPLCHVSG
jgi:hypothetical protein